MATNRSSWWYRAALGAAGPAADSGIAPSSRWARWLAVAVSLFALATSAQARGQPRTSAQGRPADAPLLASPPAVPPLPPEYLVQQVGGMRFGYHPSLRDRVRPLIESAERERYRLQTELGRPVLEHVEIRLALTLADRGRIMPRVPTVPPDEAAPVMAFAQLGLLVIDLGAEPGRDPPEPAATFRHGLAHLALDEATGMARVPPWFHEGYAAHHGEPSSWGRARTLGWASLRRALVPLGELDRPLQDGTPDAELAAAEAADFVGFLLADERSSSVGLLARELEQGQRFEQALPASQGRDLRELERAWRRDVARRTVFVPALASGVLLALLVAAATRLRASRRARRARRRRELDALHHELAPPQRVTIVQVERSDHEQAAEAMPLTEPPEHDVPKISHNGRWHTLH